MNNRKSSKVQSHFTTVLTYVIVLSSLLPLLWLVLTSLKTQVEALKMPPSILFKPSLENFRMVLGRGSFVHGYINSLVIALGTTSIALIFGISAGYSLSRPSGQGSKYMGRWIILARMAPPVTFAIPLYLAFSHLKMLDNYFSLIITYLTIVLPFVTWLMRGFFKSLPPEMEEAARIDGCSRIQALFRILIPSVKSGVATCAIFGTIMAWNEFFYALIISGRNTRPVSVDIQTFISAAGTDWGALTAAGLLVVAPVLLFTIFAQKGLLRGLTSGAVK
jgi:multiple sugar transport system permease protein